MVFFACLVFLQLGNIFVKTEECELKSFASLDGICNGGSADNQAVPLDTVQLFELLELPDECILVFLGDLRAELEHNCGMELVCSRAD